MQIGQAVTELSLLVSKRRSLSFNHNSGLQPGPSHSCCLRPSSCGFRDGIPHTLLVVYFSYYPWSGHSHPTPDINKAFLSLAVRTSETFSAQHSTDELVGAAAVLLRCCCCGGAAGLPEGSLLFSYQGVSRRAGAEILQETTDTSSQL